MSRKKQLIDVIQEFGMPEPFQIFIDTSRAKRGGVMYKLWGLPMDQVREQLSPLLARLEQIPGVEKAYLSNPALSRTYGFRVIPSRKYHLKVRFSSKARD